MILKYKDIPILRETLLKEQNNVCALCGLPLQLENSTLDHSHKSGRIRQVLHRNCNLYLSKFENSRQLNKITDEMFENIINNVLTYLKTEREETHPIHFKKKRKKHK